jgi:hypothetical protein
MTDLLDQDQFVSEGRSTDPVVQADLAFSQEARPTSSIPIKFIAAALILLVASSGLPAKPPTNRINQSLQCVDKSPQELAATF